MRASSLVEHRVTVVVAVLLAAAVAAAAARTKNECHSGDKAALLAIKSAFGNASFFNSWTPDTPCCEWANVSCDSSSSSTARRVVAVSFLNDAGLAGPLPGAAIARLTALQQLVLNNVPGVNGTIPHDLTRLSATLSFLTITSTGISGPVPPFLSEITALGYLSLSSNSLTGPIPASLGDMPNLYFLDLGSNRLTGTIPPLLLSKGPRRRVPIPLPQQARRRRSRRVRRPAGEPQQLELSHNDIYGDIPEQVVHLMLEYLNVSYNRLSGTVPAGGNMAWFDQSCFQHNKGLCGTPLPPCKE
ncbi:hypothetical protein PR202_ga04493 [Eleusine coracana subsp. coracana]|uniref:Leucine-rich repeat-containing N-terminal plant-type domain-containing protein n=1 Tax=Eleusine coracana subsp. coracana TaxID=191504 RepID=A0AAV5BS43_ELECO|nr:hypothetical protein PR202_ga04493 [Eleusine coracana subsp. coracana]